MFWVKNSVYFYGLRPELNVDNKNVLSEAIKKSRSKSPVDRVPLHQQSRLFLNISHPDVFI